MSGDTSLGGAGGVFPETTWGLVSRLRDTTQHRAALEDLCRRYWKPVYRYARAAWSKSNEDAKDITQAFFLWLLEGEPLRAYAPERGGLRPYLKVLLRRFIGHREAAMQRLKRGGGAIHMSIVDDGMVVAPDADPEKLFDRAWVHELVTQAVERVRAREPEVAFKVYERFELSTERPSYADLATELGIAVGDVKNHLFRIRENVRREIRADLAQMTADARELEEEWRLLF